MGGVEGGDEGNKGPTSSFPIMYNLLTTWYAKKWSTVLPWPNNKVFPCVQVAQILFFSFPPPKGLYKVWYTWVAFCPWLKMWLGATSSHMKISFTHKFNIMWIKLIFMPQSFFTRPRFGRRNSFVVMTIVKIVNCVYLFYLWLLRIFVWKQNQTIEKLVKLRYTVFRVKLVQKKCYN